MDELCLSIVSKWTKRQIIASGVSCEPAKLIIRLTLLVRVLQAVEPLPPKEETLTEYPRPFTLSPESRIPLSHCAIGPVRFGPGGLWGAQDGLQEPLRGLKSAQEPSR